MHARLVPVPQFLYPFFRRHNVHTRNIKPRRVVLYSNLSRKWFTLYGTFVLMYKRLFDMSGMRSNKIRKVKRSLRRTRGAFDTYKENVVNILSSFVRTPRSLVEAIGLGFRSSNLLLTSFFTRNLVRLKAGYRHKFLKLGGIFKTARFFL
jgi:hypothetical protein